MDLENEYKLQILANFKEKTLKTMTYKWPILKPNFHRYSSYSGLVHVASMEEGRTAFKILTGKLIEKKPL